MKRHQVIKMFAAAAIAIFCLGLLEPASADLYVNGTTGVDTNIGTAATQGPGTTGPVKHILRAINLISGNNTIQVAAGTYIENSNGDGVVDTTDDDVDEFGVPVITATESRLLVGGVAHNIIIQGAGVGVTTIALTNNTRGVLHQGTGILTFKDLTLTVAATDGGGHCLEVSSTGWIVLDNCTVTCSTGGLVHVTATTGAGGSLWLKDGTTVTLSHTINRLYNLASADGHGNHCWIDDGVTLNFTHANPTTNFFGYSGTPVVAGVFRLGACTINYAGDETAVGPFEAGGGRLEMDGTTVNMTAAGDVGIHVGNELPQAASVWKSARITDVTVTCTGVGPAHVAMIGHGIGPLATDGATGQGGAAAVLDHCTFISPGASTTFGMVVSAAGAVVKNTSVYSSGGAGYFKGAAGASAINCTFVTDGGGAAFKFDQESDGGGTPIIATPTDIAVIGCVLDGSLGTYAIEQSSTSYTQPQFDYNCYVAGSTALATLNDGGGADSIADLAALRTWWQTNGDDRYWNDTSSIEGTTAQVVNAAAGNFTLRTDSRCIQGGVAGSDIGAVPFCMAPVVIDGRK